MLGRLVRSERESKVYLIASRLYKMSAAKGGEKVVKRYFIRQIDNRKPQRGSIGLGVEEIIGSERYVK
jgi:hypothetical protein